MNLKVTLTIACAVVFGLSVSSPAANAEGDSITSTNTSADFSTIKASAEKGEPKALFDLARAYERGIGVSKDQSKALEYTRMAAEKGYPPAELQLGSYYGRGFGVAKDIQEAILWYRRAADHGFALAQFAMGGFYEAGTGVPRDMDQAVFWYKKAADQGDPAAQCELGVLYYDNLVGDTNQAPNLTEAVKWLKMAADQGYIGAMNNLGLAYCSGFGGLPNDPATGAKYLRQAANHGNAKAQANLGEMYRTARGVPKDLVQAYVWLRLAADGGSVDGKHSAPEVDELLTPAQKERAEEMIRAFKPLPKTAIQQEAKR
jgi:TPR repeat protein